MLKLIPLNSDDPEESILISSAKGERVIITLLDEFFEQTLVDFAKVWEKRISKFPGLLISQKKLDKMKAKNIDIETQQRLKKKLKASFIRPTTIQDYLKLRESRASHMLRQLFQEKASLSSEKELK